jgi:hypothetical protein
MIDIDEAIQARISYDLIQGRKVRRFPIQSPPKIQSAQPEERAPPKYVPSTPELSEDSTKLHEIEGLLTEEKKAELEKLKLKRAAITEVLAIVGEVRKLRESQSEPTTFLTAVYPKLSENEEHTLDEAYRWMDKLHEYAKTFEGLNFDALFSKDKLTGEELDILARYNRFKGQVDKVTRTIAALSAKKYAQKPIGRRELT